MKTKIFSVSIALVLVISLLFVACAAPTPTPTKPEVIKWRFHTPHTAERPEYEIQLDWISMVEEATDGRLKITPYLSGALGFKDGDMLRVVGDGIIEAAFTWPPYVARDEPALNLIVPNMVVTTREDFVALTPYGIEQYEKVYDSWNIAALSFEPGLACFGGINSSEPITTLEALEGKKLRTWCGTTARIFQKLDVAAEVLPQAEVYLALKSGLMDAALGTPAGTLGWSIHEVAPYYTELMLVMVLTGHIVNKDALQALPSDVRDKLLEASKEHAQKWLEFAASDDACKTEIEDIAKLKELGVTVLAFSDEDRGLISNIAIEVWRELGEKAGGEALEYQKLMEAEYNRIKTD